MPAIRLLLDEDVRALLARILRERGYDAVSVVEAGLGERADPELLAWATRDGRAILTHNTGDYVVLAKEYVERGWEHAGIIVSNRVPIRELLARILRLLSRKRPEDLQNTLEWLHNFR